MHRRCAITEAERGLIRSIRGKELTRVFSDGWALFLECSGIYFCFEPQEIAAPDETHPFGSVTRPGIRDATGSENVAATTIATALGRVSAAAVLTTRITFSPPRLELPVEVRGVTIPAGVGYSPIFAPPDDGDPRTPNARVVTDVDVSIQLVTDNGRGLDVFTDGVGFFVHAGVDSLFDAGWRAFTIRSAVF